MTNLHLYKVPPACPQKSANSGKNPEIPGFRTPKKTPILQIYGWFLHFWPNFSRFPGGFPGFFPCERRVLGLCAKIGVFEHFTKSAASDAFQNFEKKLKIFRKFFGIFGISEKIGPDPPILQIYLRTTWFWAHFWVKIGGVRNPEISRILKKSEKFCTNYKIRCFQEFPCAQKNFLSIGRLWGTGPTFFGHKKLRSSDPKKWPKIALWRPKHKVLGGIFRQKNRENSGKSAGSEKWVLKATRPELEKISAEIRSGSPGRFGTHFWPFFSDFRYLSLRIEMKSAGHLFRKFPEIPKFFPKIFFFTNFGEIRKTPILTPLF